MAVVANPFAAPTEHSNVVLIVEGKKLHVFKEFLAAHSPVFSAMLFGDFAEKGKDEVELKDVKYEEFVNLLKVIHPGWTPITAASVTQILKLAEQFEMKDAREQAEVFLMKTDKIGKDEKLFLANQYNILKFRDNSLKSMTSTDDMSLHKIHSDYANLFDATAPTDLSNVVLIVEGKKLHVFKEFLAAHSPFFDVLFFGNFVEKGKKEVEIKNVLYEEFVDLLNVIHPGWTPITASSVEYIFELAFRFQMKDALEQAEVFLTKTRKVPVEKKLFLADQYNMLKLRDHCIKSITSKHGCYSVMCADLSDAAKNKIFDRMFELEAKIRIAKVKEENRMAAMKRIQALREGRHN